MHGSWRCTLSSVPNTTNQWRPIPSSCPVVGYTYVQQGLRQGSRSLPVPCPTRTGDSKSNSAGVSVAFTLSIEEPDTPGGFIYTAHFRRYASQLHCCKGQGWFVVRHASCLWRRHHASPVTIHHVYALIESHFDAEDCQCSTCCT